MRESRTYGSVRAKAESLSYSTNLPFGRLDSFKNDSLAFVELEMKAPGIVDFVFCVCIAGGRRLPVFIQSSTYLFVLHDHLPARVRAYGRFRA